MSYKRPAVLFATFEAVPFIKTGGLGDVGGTLPAALKRGGCDCRVVLPKLDTIPEEYKSQMTHVTDFYMYLGWRNLYCGVETLRYQGVTYYFLDNEYYFKRGNAYGYFDDGERIAFFSKAVCEFIKYIDFEPEILHCNDWHTALCPVFLREFYMQIDKYKNIKTVFTVHNLKFQGKFDKFVLGDILGLDNNYAARTQMLEGDAVNFMRGALNYSDRLTTVSPTYAEEICTDAYGEGLNDVYNRRKSILSGILNGIDPKAYDPMNDPYIYAPFNKDDLSGKTENKLALQRELGLEEGADIPLIGIVSRLTSQKGLDLVNYIMNDLMKMRLEIVILGVGDAQYEESFRYFQSRYPDKVSANICFSTPLSHKIYAASDFILVPSLFEPCGLSQMIAMRYGTLPIVRETGGLKDTVIPYNQYTGEGTGFTFRNFNAHELLYAIERAVGLYYDYKEPFALMVQNAFAQDFSWKISARKYKALYRELIPEPEEPEKTEEEKAQKKKSSRKKKKSSKKKSSAKSKKSSVKKQAAQTSEVQSAPENETSAREKAENVSEAVSQESKAEEEKMEEIKAEAGNSPEAANLNAAQESSEGTEAAEE